MIVLDKAKKQMVHHINVYFLFVSTFYYRAIAPLISKTNCYSRKCSRHYGTLRGQCQFLP